MAHRPNSPDAQGTTSGDASLRLQNQQMPGPPVSSSALVDREFPTDTGLHGLTAGHLLCLGVHKQSSSALRSVTCIICKLRSRTFLAWTAQAQTEVALQRAASMRLVTTVEVIRCRFAEVKDTHGT